MSIIDFAGGEEGLEGEVARKNEAGEIDEEGSSQVEEDEEEVQAAESKSDVDLGNASLSLKIVEDFVLG